MMLLTALPYAASEQDATKLQITDKDGAVTVVTGLDFDYSNYPGGFGWYKPDHERQGVRMRQGQSTTTVAWRNIGLYLP